MRRLSSIFAFNAILGSKRKLSVVTTLVTILSVLVITTGVAFADAPQPVASYTVAKANSNPDGSVTVNVSGRWNWNIKCQNRYGVGWSMDWQGISTGPNPLPSWAIKSVTGFYFHVTHSYDGTFLFTGSCNGASGTWSASHTYSSQGQVPSQLCVNFYDLHGSKGKPANANQTDPALNDDNSANMGDFSIAGYCVAPVSNYLNPSQSHSPSSTTGGNYLHFLINVTNNGSSAASNVTLSTQVSEAQITSISPSSGWSCGITSSSTAFCTYAASIPPGATVSAADQVVRSKFWPSSYTLTDTAQVRQGDSDPNSNTDSVAVGKSETDHAVGYAPPEGGYITTCGSVSTKTINTDVGPRVVTIPGPTSNTCAANTFPSGQGQIVRIDQGTVSFDICNGDGGCNGKTVDVGDPQGYLTDPIIVVIRLAAGVATDSSHDGTRHVFVKKVIGTEVQFFTVPLCNPKTPTLPCLVMFERDTSQTSVNGGDLLVYIEMFSGDPIYDVGNGLGGVS